MALDWDVVRFRLSARGADGKLLSAVTGNETDEELRELALHFVEMCPAGQQRSERSGCPFRILNQLYHGSLKNLVNGMTRKALLGMFELEWEVRNEDVASSCHPGEGKLADDSEANP